MEREPLVRTQHKQLIIRKMAAKNKLIKSVHCTLYAIELTEFGYNIEMAIADIFIS